VGLLAGALAGALAGCRRKVLAQARWQGAGGFPRRAAGEGMPFIGALVGRYGS
jgi:hypothetical protein